MNFVQLLQIIALSAVITLLLTWFVVRLRALFSGWLGKRLRPRYLKPAGMRRRSARQEPDHE